MMAEDGTKRKNVKEERKKERDEGTKSDQERFDLEGWKTIRRYLNRAKRRGKTRTSSRKKEVDQRKRGNRREWDFKEERCRKEQEQRVGIVRLGGTGKSCQGR